MALTCVGPVLLAGLIAGVLAGLVQSLFQIHDQIAGFVPRVVVMVMTLMLLLPWMSGRLTDFGREYFSRPMLLPGSQVHLPQEGEYPAWPGN